MTTDNNITKPANISVVMGNYNHAHYIGEALNAIVGQTYKPMEVIVIDDGSTDNSIEVIEKFVKRYPVIRLLRNDINRGPMFVANRGFELTSGEYVFFAAADDMVLPGFFEKSIELLSRYSEAGVCSALSLEMDEKSAITQLCKSPVVCARQCYLSPVEAQAVLLKYGEWITGNTSIYRRDALVEIGGWRQEFQPYSDSFALLLLATKYGACFIPEPLGAWRFLGSNLSFSKFYGNRDAFFSIIGRIKEQMLSVYGDLFSREFVALWEKRHMYIFYRLGFTAALKEYENKLIKDWPPKTFADKALWTMLRLILSAASFSYRFYIAKRFHMFRAPMISQYIRYYFSNRVASRYKIPVLKDP